MSNDLIDAIGQRLHALRPGPPDCGTSDLWRGAQHLIHAGADMPTAFGVLHGAVQAWGDDAMHRITTEEIVRMIQRAASIPDDVPPRTPFAASSPAAQDQVPSGAEIASERLLAVNIADGSLRHHLRWDGGCWREWDGRCWTIVNVQIPISLAGAVHQQCGKLLANRELDPKGCRQMESTAGMRAILAQLMAYPSMRLLAEDFDGPGLLVTLGGVFNFDTGAMLAHDSARPVTKCTSVAYSAQASHMLWNAVESHATRMDPTGAMRRYLGAAAIGLPPDRKILVLHGDGGDGKSTLLRILIGALGTYATTIPAESLTEGGARGAHGHELLASLVGARLAAATEVPAKVDWPLLKALSGGDARTTKRLHGRSFTFTPRAHLVIATNEVPKVPHGDQAALERLIVIRWSKPEEPDPEIVRMLATPGPDRDSLYSAALAWIMRGASEFQCDGYGVAVPAAVGYQAPVGLEAWWADDLATRSIVLGSEWTAASKVAARAAEWAIGNGMVPPTATALGMFLKSQVAHCKRGQRDGLRTLHYQLSMVVSVVCPQSKPSPRACDRDTVQTPDTPRTNGAAPAQETDVILGHTAAGKRANA